MLFDEIFQTFHINNLKHDDPIWKNGKMFERTFTELVDRLRDPNKTKNDELNKLMSLTWRLVGNHIVPVATLEKIPTMSFFAELTNNEMAAFIVCPPHWCEMLRDDLYMQVGALVYNSSKARDYWNRKIPGHVITKEESHQRAMCYESEWLRFCQLNDPSFKPNTYQGQVLAKYQGVVDMPPEMVYDSRPFPDTIGEVVLSGPPFPVDVYGHRKTKT
jgi:hypothetical protein